MKKWRNVSLIFRREVRDQLRDRRTLFMIAVLPLLLYPALGLGLFQSALMLRQQPGIVVVLGAENLPDEPQLIDGNRFVTRWLPAGADPARLVVITDQPEAADSAPEAEGGAKRESLLRRAREIRAALHEDRQKAGELFGTSGLQVVI